MTSTNFSDLKIIFQLAAVSLSTVSANQQSSDISNSTNYFKLQNNLLEIVCEGDFGRGVWKKVEFLRVVIKYYDKKKYLYQNSRQTL